MGGRKGWDAGMQRYIFRYILRSSHFVWQGKGEGEEVFRDPSPRSILSGEGEGEWERLVANIGPAPPPIYIIPPLPTEFNLSTS